VEYKDLLVQLIISESTSCKLKNDAQEELERLNAKDGTWEKSEFKANFCVQPKEEVEQVKMAHTIVGTVKDLTMKTRIKESLFGILKDPVVPQSIKDLTLKEVFNLI
jgi:hypothetical protein